MRLCSASSQWALHEVCFDATSVTSMLIMLCLLENQVNLNLLEMQQKVSIESSNN